MKILQLLAALAVLGVLGVLWLRRPNLPAAERGRRLAETNGCFACHGAAGTKGTANPGRTDKTVPTFAGDLMMYADDARDVRAWIVDGVTPKKKASKTWQDQRAAGALRMPAFRGKLNASQVSDLVAYIRAGLPAVADTQPVAVPQGQGAAVAGAALYVRYLCEAARTGVTYSGNFVAGAPWTIV